MLGFAPDTFGFPKRYTATRYSVQCTFVAIEPPFGRTKVQINMLLAFHLSPIVCYCSSNSKGLFRVRFALYFLFQYRKQVLIRLRRSLFTATVGSCRLASVASLPSPLPIPSGLPKENTTGRLAKYISSPDVHLSCGISLRHQRGDK